MQSIRKTMNHNIDTDIIHKSIRCLYSCSFLHFEHLCFLCASDTEQMRTHVSVHYCPGDPALIRSDNTVRIEALTIDLQSFSSLSKGLLKHSAAHCCSLSPSRNFFP